MVRSPLLDRRLSLHVRAVTRRLRSRLARAAGAIKLSVAGRASRLWVAPRHATSAWISGFRLARRAAARCIPRRLTDRHAANGSTDRERRFSPCPGCPQLDAIMLWPRVGALALFLLQWLLLWTQVVHQVRGAFQLPPFLQRLSEQTLTRDQVGGQDRVYALPSALPNVPNIRRFTPRKKHLKTHKLMRRMRKHFDAFWMSVERPADADQETVKDASVDPSLVKAVQRLNFTLRGGADDGGVTAIEPAVVEVLSAWLVQRSTCRVHYAWDDLGVLYWPRWVRRGFCKAGDSPTSSPSSSLAEDTSSASSPSLSASCSWPPGMHCVPAESRRIRILTWQCRHDKAFNNWNKRYRASAKKRDFSLLQPSRDKRSVTSLEAERGRWNESEAEEPDEINETENWSSKPWKERQEKLKMHCKWRKIRYPVTDDCFCSC